MRRSLRGARDEADFRCAQAELAGLREAAEGGEFDLYCLLLGGSKPSPLGDGFSRF